MSDLDYVILSSGSEGNAVRIRDIMIDCGIPFKRMKPELYKCHYLLITHDHGDHVSKPTLKSIVKQFPNIEIYSTYKVARLDDTVTAINTDYLPIILGKTEMYAIQVPHDAVCYAYVLRFGDLDVIYSTDLASTKELEEFSDGQKIRYDYTFLEANYDSAKLRMLGDTWHGQYNAYVSSSTRHLSKDDSLRFYTKYKKNGGEYIELHKSRRFY